MLYNISYINTSLAEMIIGAFARVAVIIASTSVSVIFAFTSVSGTDFEPVSEQIRETCNFDSSIHFANFGVLVLLIFVENGFYFGKWY